MADDTRTDLFSEQIEPTDDTTTEELTSDNTPMDDTEANRGFRERLSEDEGDEFTRALDPEENPHIGDQLDDPNLQREAEADY